jgi:hypothetical protein
MSLMTREEIEKHMDELAREYHALNNARKGFF